MSFGRCSTSSSTTTSHTIAPSIVPRSCWGCFLKTTKTNWQSLERLPGGRASSAGPRGAPVTATAHPWTTYPPRRRPKAASGPHSETVSSVATLTVPPPPLRASRSSSGRSRAIDGENLTLLTYVLPSLRSRAVPAASCLKRASACRSTAARSTAARASSLSPRLVASPRAFATPRRWEGRSSGHGRRRRAGTGGCFAG